MNRIVKKSEKRRQEIILASRELFLKQDYENTSMKDIMDKLNIAKGTIYHYLKSKKALLKAVVEQIVAKYLIQMRVVLKETLGNSLKKMRALFNTSHPLESAEFLLAGIQFMTDLGNFPWKQKDLERRAAAISAVLETQLGAPKGSFNFLINIS